MRTLWTLAFAGIASFPTHPAANAASFNSQCPDIQACAKVVGELLGQKYVFSAELKGKVVGTPNLELTKENAELLFTSMLNSEGFTRVPLAGEVGTFQIARQRDARDSVIPVVAADQRNAPSLPNNWDLHTLKYKASHPETLEAIARLARTLMPPNARIVPVELSGTLLVTDTALNLKKLYDLIRENDVAATPELKRLWDEAEKKRRMERMQMERLRADHAGNDEPRGAPAPGGPAKPPRGVPPGANEER